MRGFRVRRVELAVHDAVTGGHGLELVAAEDVGPGEAIAVRQTAVDHVGQDLHVAMAVWSKPLAGRDAVFFEHAQDTKAGEVRVLVAAERKCGARAQPSEFGGAAILTPANADHGRRLTAPAA